MERVTGYMTNDNLQYHSRLREQRMDRLRTQMGTQTRIHDLRDAPLAAAHSTRYQSYQVRLERFSSNIEYAQSTHEVTEGNLRNAVDILQRVRELAVQGANGTYTESDLRAMGTEVNELLEQLVQIGNARDPEGTTLFSGTESTDLPFQALNGPVPGNDGEMITEVRYTGDIDTKLTEISQGAFVGLNIPGNEAFWAENQQVYSNVDGTGYQLDQDARVSIGGEEIQLREGDNLYSIVAKINDSDAPVEASVDPVRGSLMLRTTSPRQLWLQDLEGGTVLQDLGILDGGASRPPDNLAAGAQVFGGSVFDMVISLRDELLAGDSEDVGAGALGGIDRALDGVLSTLGRIGAQGARLDLAYTRVETEIAEVAARNSEAVDLDFTEAVTDLQMLEYTHRAALSAFSRVTQPTLLDFLR